jgi:DDE superfamily endonuclease
MKTDLDLYTDYLLSSFGQTTATGLSRMLDQAVSHDEVTRFLSHLDSGSSALWHQVKPLIRQVEKVLSPEEHGCLLLDDTIIEKAYSDENGLVSVHYDHSKYRYVKGINLVSAILLLGRVSLPVAYELVVKTLQCELKNRKEVWKSERTKNEMFRDMVSVCVDNTLRFSYVLCDSWYTNAENIKHVLGLKKHLIGAVKSNLEVALSLADKKAGKFVKLNQLVLELGLKQVYIRQLEVPVFLCKDLFINEDGSKAVQYLLCTDLTLSFQQVITTYQKRWGVEEYHKSLKQNTSVTKAPVKTMVPQANHLFASICAFVKLERLKIVEHTNHFALKAKLYIKATQAAFQELAQLKIKLA